MIILYWPDFHTALLHATLLCFHIRRRHLTAHPTELLLCSSSAWRDTWEMLAEGITEVAPVQTFSVYFLLYAY